MTPPTAARIAPEAGLQPDSPTTILFNSVVAAVLGSGLMVLIHELVHLLTGVAMGIPGVLYPFGVQHDPAGNVQNAIMAASAPVFSLVSGFLLSLWLPLRNRGGFGHLLWLWVAFTSMMEGIGYLVITPFGAGDTASTVSYLGWPLWVAFALCAVGIAGQFLLARHFAPHVGRHAGTDGKSKRAFALWPWVIGTVVNVALAFLYLTISNMALSTGEVVAIVAAASATLVFAPMALMYGRAIKAVPPEPLGLRRLPVAGLVGIAALIGLNYLLHFGFRLG